VTEGRYIYCISESSRDQNLDAVGILGRPVFFVGFKDIGAYVSKVPYEDLETNIQTIETHQHVVELSRVRVSTLPVKFGVIFKTDDGVKTLLTKSYDDYKSKLTKFRNKDEFGLKVLITKQTSGIEPKAPKRGKTSVGEGASYFQKLRDEETKRSDELKKWDKIRGVIREELSEHAEQQTVLSSDLPQILLNAAYLVDRKKTAAFESSGKNVRLRFEPEGLAFHMSGPWAPYSFC
jgi:hypothetical protein